MCDMLSSTVTIMYYASAALPKSSRLEGPFNFFFSLPIKVICMETHLSQFDEIKIKSQFMEVKSQFC